MLTPYLMNPAKKFLLLVVYSFCAFLLVACSSSEDNSTPEGAVKLYFQALSDNNAEKALSLMKIPNVPEGPEKQMIDAKLKMVVDKAAGDMKTKGGLKNIEVLKTDKVSDSSSSVQVKIEYTDGSSEEETLKTILSDGKWFIELK